MKSRCEEVVVTVIVRTYNEADEPTGERHYQPVKVFRNADSKDFWAKVDEMIAKANASTPDLTGGGGSGA